MRQQQLQSALSSIVEAWQSNPEELESEELWDKVEGAMRMPHRSIRRPKLQSLSDEVWRKNNGTAAIERRKANEV